MTSSPRLTLVMLAVLVGPVTGCAAPEEGPPIPSSQLAPPTAGYEEVADSARELSRTFFAREGLPGLSVAVGIDGEVVWAEGFGWADLGQESLLTPLSLLRVGSVSKPLTAAAVGLLYERGLLDLDAPVQDYVPDFPLKRWPVTTRLLMGHIAGVRHYRGDEGRSTQSCDAVPERLAVFADDTLLFEPGHDYSYSSYGWTLIAAVVEAVAKEPFLDFMDREVFVPLGLDDTRPDLVDETMPELPIRPEIIRNSVVLPAPFGPSTPVMPGPNEQVTSETATLVPNHFETPATSTVGSATKAGSAGRLVIGPCGIGGERAHP